MSKSIAGVKDCFTFLQKKSRNIIMLKNRNFFFISECKIYYKKAWIIILSSSAVIDKERKVKS